MPRRKLGVEAQKERADEWAGDTKVARSALDYLSGPVVSKFPKYPREMIALRVDEGDVTWFEAHDDLEGLSNGDLVGVYQLVDVRRVKVSVELNEIEEMRER